MKTTASKVNVARFFGIIGLLWAIFYWSTLYSSDSPAERCSAACYPNGYAVLGEKCYCDSSLTAVQK